MSETSRPDVDEHRQAAERLHAARPDYASMSPADLVAYQRTVMREHYPPVLRTHLRMVYEGSLAAGALEQALARFDDLSLAVRLMSGLGNVASAAPNDATWRLGRMVNKRPAVAALSLTA